MLRKCSVLARHRTQKSNFGGLVFAFLGHERAFSVGSKPYIKLDIDWRDDEKVVRLEDLFGKSYLIDWVGMMCLMSRFDGCIDLSDRSIQRIVVRDMRKRLTSVRKSIDAFAEVGLVDKGAWERSGLVMSERSLKDAEAKRKRRQYALEASEAAAEARRKRREEIPP